MAITFNFIYKLQQFGKVTYDLVISGDISGRVGKNYLIGQDTPAQLTADGNSYITFLQTQANREAKRNVMLDDINTDLQKAFEVLLTKTPTNAQLTAIANNLDNILGFFGSDES